jgi:F-type H+-transporting ATPase subunit alpha
LPVEDQVIQIFAATSGFLDRIHSDRVPEFLSELTERSHSEHGELRSKIADGGWSDEIQKQAREAIEAFASDFGYDLDEEGQPLEETVPA